MTRVNRHAEGAGQAGAAIATEGQRQPLVGRREAIRPSAARRHHGGQALGENLLRTGRLVTKEPSGAQNDHDLNAGQGQIGDLAGIATMDALGGLVALWTWCCELARAQGEGPGAVGRACHDLVAVQDGGIGKEPCGESCHRRPW